METQIEGRRSTQDVRQGMDKPGFKWLLIALVGMSAVLIAAILVADLPPKNPQINVQRVQEAGAARYTGLAAYYMAKDETTLQRANLAGAARYSTRAAYDMAKARPASQGAIMADTARYTGLAEYYLVEKEAGTLLRSHEAAAARYSALAAYHLAKEGSANP